jgi:TPR repeat protein
LSIVALQVGCDSKPDEGTAAPAFAASTAGGTSLRAKAETGDADAMLQLGRALTSGSNGESKDEFEAFKWLLRAAQAGNPTAMGEVARRYREGRGTRENWESSVQWADKGAEKGDPESLYLSTIRGPFDLFLGWEPVIGSESEEAKLVRDAARAC